METLSGTVMATGVCAEDTHLAVERRTFRDALLAVETTTIVPGAVAMTFDQVAIVVADAAVVLAETATTNGLGAIMAMGELGVTTTRTTEETTEVADGFECRREPRRVMHVKSRVWNEGQAGQRLYSEKWPGNVDNIATTPR